MDTLQVLNIKIVRMTHAIACHTEPAEITRLTRELDRLKAQYSAAQHETGVQRPEPKREEDGDLLFA